MATQQEPAPTLQDALEVLRPELPSGRPDLAIEQIALRKAHDYLQDRGQAGTRDLRRFLEREDLHRYYANGQQFWIQVMVPYLGLLPGVVAPDGPSRPWRYDPDADRRPAVPEDPTPAPEERIDSILADAIDFPGFSDQKNRVTLKNAYEQLREQGEATTDELRDAYSPTPDTVPSQGRFEDTADWFREVGRPTLRKLPGVDPPRVAGQPWRFVGIDVDGDATDGGTGDA